MHVTQIKLKNSTNLNCNSTLDLHFSLRAQKRGLGCSGNRDEMNSHCAGACTSGTAAGTFFFFFWIPVPATNRER